MKARRAPADADDSRAASAMKAALAAIDALDMRVREAVRDHLARAASAPFRQWEAEYTAGFRTVYECESRSNEIGVGWAWLTRGYTEAEAHIAHAAVWVYRARQGAQDGWRHEAVALAAEDGSRDLARAKVLGAPAAGPDFEKSTTGP